MATTDSARYVVHFMFDNEIHSPPSATVKFWLGGVFTEILAVVCCAVNGGAAVVMIKVTRVQ